MRFNSDKKLELFGAYFGVSVMDGEQMPIVWCRCNSEILDNMWDASGFKLDGLEIMVVWTSALLKKKY